MRNRYLAILPCLLALTPLTAEEKPAAPEGAAPEKPVAPERPAGRPDRSGPGGGRGFDGSFFREADKDGDGAISKEEAGDRWERLARFDKDGDGKVTMQELMAARPGEGRPGAPGEGRPGFGGGEMFTRLDKNNDGKISKDEAPAEMWDRLARLDKDGDGAISKEEMAAGAAMMPGRPGEGRPRFDGGEMFTRLDKNNDGKISKDEAPAEMWDRLARLDKDGDGAISKEEMAAGAAMMPGRPGEGRPGPGRPGMGPGGGAGAIFEQYDADKDGKLSKSEVPAEMWERLSKADENADGLVSKEELESVFRARQGGPGPGAGPGRPGEPKPESE